MSPRSSNRSGRSNQRDKREESEVEPQSAATDSSQPVSEPTADAEASRMSDGHSADTTEVSAESANARPVQEQEAVTVAEVTETPVKPADGSDAVAEEPVATAAVAEKAATEGGSTATEGEPAAPAGDANSSATEPAGETREGEDVVKPVDESTPENANASLPPPAVSTAAPVEPGSKPPRSRAGVAGLLFALLALAGVGAVGWQVYELREATRELNEQASQRIAVTNEFHQETAQRIAATDSVAIEARAFANRTSEAFDGMQRRFGAIEARVDDMAGQTAALEAVYLAATRSRSDQVLAEVEQAINAAAQQLQMAGNVEAAVIALEGVEARLAQPEFGHFHALRRALVRDLETLRALPRVDVGGIALRLELILERVDKLPLAFETMLAEREEDSLKIEVAKAQGDAWEWTLGMLKALGADIWNEIKGMVRLERIDSGDPVLLSPDQTAFLRENIKMRLLTARLALLSRDGKTYAGDLERAREWMERYFDNSNPQVQQSIKELAELAAVPMRVEMPSLLDTFSALRVVQARGATAAEDAPASGESR